MESQDLRSARVEIDLSALRHNVLQVQKRAPQAGVMAVIKANAYGHGLSAAVNAFSSADEFAVRGFDEAKQLIELGVKKPITLLSESAYGSDFGDIEPNIRPAIFDWHQLHRLIESKPREPLNVWLKVDTGMGRLGFLLKEVKEALSLLEKSNAVKSVSLMSHLANADDIENKINYRQLDQIVHLLDEFGFEELSVLNSGGVLGFADRLRNLLIQKSGVKEMVRPGLMLYGASPIFDQSAQQLDLRPAMTFKAPIVSIRSLPAGAQIGYGSTVALEKKSRVGVIACGYGDGYPRHAENGTPILVNGEVCPLLGRVSMDLISVDLSRCDADIGDEAVLWGAGNPIEKIALNSSTIAYTLMCGISNRVERVELNG